MRQKKYKNVDSGFPSTGKLSKCLQQLACHHLAEPGGQGQAGERAKTKFLATATWDTLETEDNFPVLLLHPGPCSYFPLSLTLKKMG